MDTKTKGVQDLKERILYKIQIGIRYSIHVNFKLCGDFYTRRAEVPRLRNWRPGFDSQQE